MFKKIIYISLMGMLAYIVIHSEWFKPVVIKPDRFTPGVNVDIKNADYKKASFKESNSAKSKDVEIWSGATGTAYTSIPITKVISLDSEYLAQGVCVKLKDEDGLGYSYISVNKGALKATTTSCE